MAQPIDVRNFSPQSLVDLVAALGENLTQAEIQAAMEAALAASEPIDVNIVGGSAVPFATQVQTVPAPPAVTQLNALATPNGALIRADEDMFIYNNGTPGAGEGFLVYEGDDIKMTTVTNLDQVFVLPAKNQSITVWAMTL